MKLIIFATHLEGGKTLSALNACRLDDSLYSFPDGYIAISGMGLCAAQHAASRTISLVNEVWNLGFAASLDAKYPLGSIHEISTINKYTPATIDLDPGSQALVRSSFPALKIGDEGHKLLSSDHPIHDVSLKNQLREFAHFIDMEGYGIAYAAKAFGKPCRMWKIVSDFASPEGRKLIFDHQHTLSEKLATLVTEELCQKLNK